LDALPLPPPFPSLPSCHVPPFPPTIAIEPRFRNKTRSFSFPRTLLSLLSSASPPTTAPSRTWTPTNSSKSGSPSGSLSAPPLILFPFQTLTLVTSLPPLSISSLSTNDGLLTDLDAYQLIKERVAKRAADNKEKGKKAEKGGEVRSQKTLTKNRDWIEKEVGSKEGGREGGREGVKECSKGRGGLKEGMGRKGKVSANNIAHVMNNHSTPFLSFLLLLLLQN